jgi:hypothetical protein
MKTTRRWFLLPAALAGVACGSPTPPPMPSLGPGITGGSADNVYGDLCPSSPPVDGTACVPVLEDEVVCEYGDDPRGELCHVAAICIHNAWSVLEVSPSCPPARDPGTCPASADDARDQPCAVSGSFCVFGPIPCECTSCPAGGGLDLKTCPGAPTWHCAAGNPANDPGCPPARRNLGTTCEDEALDCDYGCQSGNVEMCRGVWIPDRFPQCPPAQ